MAVKVAINSFGRIGKRSLREACYSLAVGKILEAEKLRGRVW